MPDQLILTSDTLIITRGICWCRAKSVVIDFGGVSAVAKFQLSLISALYIGNRWQNKISEADARAMECIKEEQEGVFG